MADVPALRTFRPAPDGIRFDIFAWQAVPWPVMRDDARYLEGLPFGTVWVGDHFASPPAPTSPLLEAWTTLAALAAETTHIRLGTAVSNVATRHPAMLAKQAATVDCISNGRLDLGLGPGFYESEHAWMGIPFLTPAGRVDRLREAAEIVDGLLRQAPLTYEGDYYKLDAAPLVPAPMQSPRPPLLLAANGKRALRLVAEIADGWLSLGDTGASVDEALPGLRERGRVLDEHCAAIGRDPGTVERAYFTGWADECPFASASALEDFVGRYREAGIRRFIFLFASEGLFRAGVAHGKFADRAALDAFGAAVLARLQGIQA